MKFQVADAEELPFDDGSFDVVLSTFGAMFTPDHTRPAREMLRVVRSGGRIGLANWTPEGFIGQLFKIVGAYLPPPAGLKSPALWGTEPHIVELFGAQAADIKRRAQASSTSATAPRALARRCSATTTARRTRRLRRSIRAQQEAFEVDIIALLNRLNVGGRHSLVVPSEYLEVVITKR